MYHESWDYDNYAPQVALAYICNLPSTALGYQSKNYRGSPGGDQVLGLRIGEELKKTTGETHNQLLSKILYKLYNYFVCHIKSTSPFIIT